MKQTARQIEIVETALSLIDEKGIQGLTIKNLSKKIGISEPAIYRHYENKIEILLALLDYFKDYMASIIKQVNQKENALEKIEALFTGYFESFTNNRSLVTVIFSEELFRNETMLSDKTASIIANNISMLTNILEQGRQNNEIRTDLPVEHLAVMVMGSLRLYVKNWQLTGYDSDIRKSGKELINSIKEILRK